MTCTCKEKFYLTTAIAYTSAKPHIGNTYEVVLADAIARFKRKQGYEVFFQTGTDEHGQKIEDKAKAANQEPKEFVDGIAAQIQSIFDLMNTSYDKFIRTTDSYHEKQVQKIFKKLYQQGDIYKGYYEGWYCKACESFFTQAQLQDGKCPDCGAEVSLEKEEAYFLNLQKYADRLVEHIETHPEFIQPVSRKNEMVNNFIKPGLQDLCVSRTSFKWGIPVDFDPNHVVYVWIDALSNYITGLGYDVDGQHGDLYKRFWPADVHLIGKDILRFHTIYWPIMLMALDIPLPKQVFGHPWLLVNDNKMSKSKGNVIYADDLVKLFGVDAVRYIMLKEMPYAQDGTVNYESMVESINSDLANVLGNLVNRTIAMTNKYFQGTVSNKNSKQEHDTELEELCVSVKNKVNHLMDELRVSDSIVEIFSIYRRCNKYIDECEPWVLAKDPNKQDRLETVLYNLIKCIRYASILLESFLPETATNILKQLQVETCSLEELNQLDIIPSYTVTNQAEILFKRLDVNEVLAAVTEEVVTVEHLPEISIEDFNKVELTTGQVLACKKHPKADKLLILQVKINQHEERQIVSGLAAYYKPEELVGKKLLVCVNLKPIKLKGEESKGMIVTTESEGHVRIIESTAEVGCLIK